MISISNKHVVSWPTPAGPAVAPVSPVTAVQPVREAVGDPQTGFGAGREGQDGSPRAPGARSARAEAESAPEAAPLLPGRAGPGGADRRSGPEAGPASVQEKNQEKAELAAAQQAEEPPEAAAQSQQLQAVLTSVWQASAAVVERALDRLAGAPSAVPGTRSDTSPELSAAQLGRRSLLPPAVTHTPLEPLPWPVMPPSEAEQEAAPGVNGPTEIRPVEEAVAYDENGHCSWALVEAGSIVNERV